MPKKILVTGKNGQLGQSIQKLVDSSSEFEYTFVGRDELDLAEPQAISDYFSNKTFDVIINCAAYTAVDKAESEPEAAEQINHFAVKQLAEIAKAQQAYLIHISTDYVFNGQGYRPYQENDETGPEGVYGLTKLQGEQAMQAINPKGCIIRTSWVYSEFGNNFVKTMLRLAQDRDQLNVIFDQVGSPTYAGDLAQAIVQVLCHSERSEESLCLNGVDPELNQTESKIEIYHYSNEGVCSWYDFAKSIFELSHVNCQVNPIETKDYPTPAKRPFYSLMNKAKIKTTFGLTIPYWQDSLKTCLNEIEK